MAILLGALSNGISRCLRLANQQRQLLRQLGGGALSKSTQCHLVNHVISSDLEQETGVRGRRTEGMGGWGDGERVVGGTGGFEENSLPLILSLSLSP